MDDTRALRWAVASGYLVVLLGVAGASFERGAPVFGAADSEVAAFFVQYRTELLIQSLLLVLSAGVSVWFLAGLRSYLLRAEGPTGVYATLAYGAGVLGVGISALLHGPQVALAMVADGELAPGLAAAMGGLGFVLSLIALVPTAVMLAAVAAASLRTGVFPRWLAWLSAITAALHVAAWFGVLVTEGPLAPGGALTYVVYLLYVVWLISVTTMMVMRLRGPTRVDATSSSPDHLVGPSV